MKLCCVYMFVAVFLLGSCKPSTWPDNKSAINELVNKYPELYGKGRIGLYKPVRTLDDNVDSIKMQLLEADHGDEQIVVFSNQKGQAYAVPFPDNDYHAYWQFYGESVTGVPANKNFSAEIEAAFKKLLNRSNLKSEIYNELMISLIQCRPVLTGDTTKSTNDHSRSSFPDSCLKISRHNFQNMVTNTIASITSSYRYLDTFDDIRHYRFFQATNNDDAWDRSNNRLIVYRKPCVVRPVYLWKSLFRHSK